MPVCFQILIFVVGMLISSAVFAFVMSHVRDNLTKEVFSWLGLVIMVGGLVAGLLSFIPPV